jgi:hypothetical protein
MDFIMPKKCGLGAPQMVRGSREYDLPGNAPFVNKSLSYPGKIWACNSANGMALGIGSSTLPINEFYYS